MACVSPTGGITAGPFTIGTFMSQWLPLILNAWLAYEYMQEAEEAEDELEKIGKKSLDAAECLFDAYMQLRDKDCEVIDFANDQPLYRPCDRSVHAIQAARQSTDFLKTVMGSTSRFDCGTRQQGIRAAQRAFILGSMQEQEEQWQYEYLLEDSYYEAYYDSIASVSLTANTSGLSSAFGGSAGIWDAQLQSANIQTAGALQGVGYFGGSAYSLFGRNSQPQVPVGYNSNSGGGYSYL